MSSPNVDPSEFGEKRISQFQSICLLLNNITGAAMVLYPGLFQSSGWLLPTFCMFLCAALSTIAGLSLCKAMQMIPYNERFQQRYEFTNIAMIYFSYRQYQIFFFFFTISLFTSVVPLIIQSAQVMDFTLIAIFGKTCGLVFSPSFTGLCTSATGSSDPFIGSIGDATTSPIVLSLGIVVLALVCIPISFWNLDDNMNIQVGATFGMVGLITTWVIYFWTNGLDASSLPTVGTDVSKVLGIVVFNFAFVTGLPSWVNEKSPSTSVNVSVKLAVLWATLLTLFIAIFGALAYPPFFDSGNDILTQLSQSSSGFIRLTYYLFPIIVNLSSIPVACIIIRYNLLSNQLVSRRVANLLAIGLPWMLVIPFYGGNGFNQFIVWSGVIVTGVVNFVIPVYIYVLAVRKYGHEQDAGFLGPSAEGASSMHSELEYSIYGDLDSGSNPKVPTGAFSTRSLMEDDYAPGDDFVDPLESMSCSAPQPTAFHETSCSDSLGFPCLCLCWSRSQRPSRSKLAWTVIALFACLIGISLGIDIYYVATGRSLV